MRAHSATVACAAVAALALLSTIGCTRATAPPPVPQPEPSPEPEQLVVCADRPMKLAPSDPAPSYIAPREVLQGALAKQLEGDPESIVREDRRRDYPCERPMKRDDYPSETAKRCFDVAVAHDAIAGAKERQLFVALASAPEMCEPQERDRIAILHSNAKTHRQSAIAAIVRSLRQHAQLSETDAGYAFLAWQHERVADRAEAFREAGTDEARDRASQLRDRLTDYFIDSPWLPKALADEAEAVFRHGEAERALELYKRALKSPTLDDHLKAYLLYRSAWCSLRKNEAADANRNFDAADALAKSRSKESWSAPLRAAIAKERPAR